MIDSSLIIESSKEVKESIKNKKILVSDNLFFINDLFPSFLLQKLCDYTKKSTDYSFTEDLVGKISSPLRFKLSFKHDTVLEEAYHVLDSITNDLEEIFDKKLKFNGYTIWKDLPGFHIMTHSDNPSIEVALQIYLSEHTKRLGTVFNLDKQYIVPYKQNCGYLMDNSKKTTHQMSIPVPKNHIRYSLYAVWTIPNK